MSIEISKTSVVILGSKCNIWEINILSVDELKINIKNENYFRLNINWVE